MFLVKVSGGLGENLDPEGAESRIMRNFVIYHVGQILGESRRAYRITREW